MNIYDIAKMAGVSASTVSRVINNKKGVKKETRELVQKFLDEFNYTPNETARGLVNQASRLIGILISDIRTAYHTESVYNMEKEFTKRGYCCIIMNTGFDEEARSNYIQIMNQRQVEAVALIGSTFQSENVEKAIAKFLPSIPVVIVNGHLDLPNVYSVIADEQTGVTNCVKYLSEKNRKNLAFVIDNFTPSNKLKMKGFENGVKQYCDQDKPLIVNCDSSFTGAYNATQELIINHPEINGIIYVVDLLAVAGCRALRDMKVKIPKQVAVIGVDNSLYSEISSPRLTSLDNKLFELSVTSARNLIDALQSKRVAKELMILSNLVEREST
jgi:LacI family transcriptional regulator